MAKGSGMDGMGAKAGTPRDERIWDLHFKGLAPSQISKELGCGEETARRVICVKWFEDKRSARKGRT